MGCAGHSHVRVEMIVKQMKEVGQVTGIQILKIEIQYLCTGIDPGSLYQFFPFLVVFMMRAL